MNTKLEDIIALGKPAVLKLQSEINLFYKKNTQDFIKSLEGNDIVTAKKLYGHGLDWSEGNTWKKIASIWRGAASSPEIVKFIWTLNPDQVYTQQTNQVGNYDKFKIMPNKQEVLREFLKSSLEEMFKNYTHLGINNYLADWILNHNKDDLDSSDRYLNSLCSCVSKNDIANNVEFVEKLVTAYPKQVFLFLDNAQKPEEFNALLKSKVFMQIIGGTSLEIEEGRIKNMEKAVERGNMNQITFYSDLGVPLPTSKAPYSVLFSKPDKLEAMEYVINNIPDISVGSNVILKTALHHNKYKLVPDIVNKYPSDALEELEASILKRDDSPSVDIVKKTIMKMKLDKDLAAKPQYHIIKI
jgi:hypothetical protein